MGSNMAECHPVAFRWVMKAKTRETDPCTVIHADPRFTRTSAMANIYAPVRAGSDIVFLGALIRHVLDQLDAILAKPADQRDARDRFFHDYLLNYTNAPMLITEEYRDAEDGEGLFSGFQAQPRRYDATKWRYDTEPRADGQHNQADPGEGRGHGFAADVGRLIGPRPREDRTLRNPRCV